MFPGDFIDILEVCELPVGLKRLSNVYYMSINKAKGSFQASHEWLALNKRQNHHRD
jgi:hypothetical protein